MLSRVHQVVPTADRRQAELQPIHNPAGIVQTAVQAHLATKHRAVRRAAVTEAALHVQAAVQAIPQDQEVRAVAQATHGHPAVVRAVAQDRREVVRQVAQAPDPRVGRL